MTDQPKRRGRPPAPRIPAPVDDASAVAVRVIAFDFWTDERHWQGDVIEIAPELAALAIERGQVEPL